MDNYRVISVKNGFNLILLLIISWRQRGHMHVGWKNKLKRLSLTETKLFFMQIILQKTNSSKCLVEQNGRLFTWLQSTSKDLFTCIWDRVYYDDMSFFEPIWVHKPFLKCITYITLKQFNRFFFFPFQGLSARDVCVSAQQIPTLRVVPHFSSGIVERAKRQRAWKSLFSRGMIFTRPRVSLALLSPRKNGGLLVV